MESNIKEDEGTTTTTHIGENVSFSSPELPDDNPQKQDHNALPVDNPQKRDPNALSDDNPLKQDDNDNNALPDDDDPYPLTPETQAANKGLHAVTIVCRKCHRHEVQYLASPPDQDDSQIPKNSNEGGESALSRRRKYDASTREKTKCIPITGPATEYKDAYRNPDWPNPKKGSNRPQFQPQRTGKRPPWNSSISIPPPPYQETLNAVEVKLKVLDEAEDPPVDVMALAIQRQNLREKYRQKRIGGDGGDCGACDDDDDDDSNLLSSSWGWLPAKQQVFVKGSHLELLEDESLLSDV